MNNGYSAATIQTQTVATKSDAVSSATGKQVIEIGTIQAALGVVTILIAVGIAWGSLKTIVSSMKKTLDEEIKPDLKNVRERFAVVEDRVGSLWKDEYAPAHSPRQLNARGNSVLVESGIKDLVDENREKLLDLVKKKNTTNAYDAENAIFLVMMEFSRHCPESTDRLKNGAFRVGADLNSVLFVGAIYLRDLIFEDLGFKLHELDSK